MPLSTVRTVQFVRIVRRAWSVFQPPEKSVSIGAKAFLGAPLRCGAATASGVSLAFLSRPRGAEGHKKRPVGQLGLTNAINDAVDDDRACVVAAGTKRVRGLVSRGDPAEGIGCLVTTQGHVILGQSAIISDRPGIFRLCARMLAPRV